MAKKTFNIGESSYFGRWQIEIKDETIVVRGIDWDSKEVRQIDTFTLSDIPNNRLSNHLIDMSTVYYGGQMMDWVRKTLHESGTKIPSAFAGGW